LAHTRCGHRELLTPPEGTVTTSTASSAESVEYSRPDGSVAQAVSSNRLGEIEHAQLLTGSPGVADVDLLKVALAGQLEVAPKRGLKIGTTAFESGSVSANVTC